VSARGEAGAYRSSGLSRRARFALTFAGGLLGLFVFGFALFAAAVMREAEPMTGTADAIVVLTGGDRRIGEGARLLREKRAARMLISGVNAKTTRDDLFKLSGLDADTFNCCVELGYAAQDTIGNAAEARTWIGGRDLKRIIVVTSVYHMPRSLAELALTMPDVTFIPSAVRPRTFSDQEWWLNPMAARILLSEYVKYLPVAARLAAVRYLGPKNPAEPAGRGPAPRNS